MRFDFDRYKKRRFHKNDEIDKKVKALFLYYDYQVINKKMNPAQQLTLLDDWIIKFQQHELYEVIPMFKMRRAIVVKQIISMNHERMSFIEHMAPKLPERLKKIKNFFKNQFKRK